MLIAARGDESLSCGSNAAPQKALQLLRPKFDVRQTLSLSLLLAGEEERLLQAQRVRLQRSENKLAWVCNFKMLPVGDALGQGEVVIGV